MPKYGFLIMITAFASVVLLKIGVLPPGGRFLLKAFLAIGIIVLTALFVLRKVFGRRRAKEIIFTAVLIGVSTLIALGFCEVGARFAYKDLTTTADNHSYFWNNNFP